MSFFKRMFTKPEPRLYKCPKHGEVHGVIMQFGQYPDSYALSPKLCEKCIAAMFVRNAEVLGTPEVEE